MGALTTDYVLEVADLGKSFGGYSAVQNVNMRVSRGQVRGVIGPNGAGKTTFFNLLSGYLKPTNGKILLNGRDIAGKAPHRISRAGMSRAFQTTNIFSTFTVFDNVLMSVFARHGHQFKLWGRHNKALAEEASNILELVHLSSSRDRIANTLAHGEQRALEVAIALAHDPDILLLDEPTAGMSPYETQEMIVLLGSLIKERDMTVILSEHDMDVVFGLANTITVLEAGRVLADGTPAQIKENADVRRAYLGEIG